MSWFNGLDDSGMYWSSFQNSYNVLNLCSLGMKFCHHPILYYLYIRKITMIKSQFLYLKRKEKKQQEHATWKEKRERLITIREFQGMVGRSWLNNSVAPNSSTTQLSLSQSIIVLSKSKITTMPVAIFFFFYDKWTNEGRKERFSRQDTKKKRNIDHHERDWRIFDWRGLL